MNASRIQSLAAAGRISRSRGFTLAELMVSLVMGLIVAMAAVMLARTATTTFHEQARSSQTEMSVRMASERLRQDLMRVSYMSTGNIVLDPKVAQLNGVAAKDISRNDETATLRGIAIDVSMVNSDGGIPAPIKANDIKPDAIDLIGNFTTDDLYSGRITTGGGGGACTGAQTITLDPKGDAAVYNLGGGTGGVVDTTVLKNNATVAFQPVAKRFFLAQVTDAIGCTHYVKVCNVDTNGAGQLLVMIDQAKTGPAVLFANAGSAANAGGIAHSCGSSEGGMVTIAPLSHVHWAITPSAPGLTNGALDGDGKFDLTRTVLDFNGSPVGDPEVVAEYAVDLRFGIVVDDPGGAGKLRQVVYDVDSDVDGTGAIYKATSPLVTSTIQSGQMGPQRIRAVRYRLAVRTSVADREQDLNVDAGAARARFCITKPTSGACTQYARVRTVTSEVALTNQAGMFY